MWLIIFGTILAILFSSIYLLAMGLIKELNKIQKEESQID